MIFACHRGADESARVRALAATVTAHQSMNVAGERLIGEEVVNAVIVLMVLTATVGPILTERFGQNVQRIPVAEAP